MSSDYYVRLAVRITADSPAGAAAGLVDLFTDKGLRDWLYRIDDAASKEMIGYFNGWGEAVDTALVENAARAMQTPEPDPEPESEPEAEPEPAEPEPAEEAALDAPDDQEDAELLALATQLNEEHGESPSVEEIVNASIREYEQ